MDKQSGGIWTIDTTELTPVETGSYQILKEQIADVLQQNLNAREIKVLELRFGLHDGRIRTLKEVSKHFAVSRERIRQIQANALRKLRHPTRSKKVNDCVDA